MCKQIFQNHCNCRHQIMINLLRVCVVGIILISPIVSALDFVFINGREGGEPRYITASNDPSLCQRSDRLNGLDMTRKVLGALNCHGERIEGFEYADDIDLVILVDDLRGVDDSLLERIDSVEGEILVCSSSGARKRIYPSYLVLRNGDSQFLKTLIVGEQMIDTYFSETRNEEPWSSYLSQIIARRQGHDAAPDNGSYSPSISGSAANGIPTGKGLFQNRALNRLVNDRYKPYKMDHFASRFHDYGLNWFALSASVGEKCEGRLYTEFIRFGHPTFQTFIWGLNSADEIDEQIDQMIRAVRNTGSQGFMIDIEGQAFRNHSDEARQLYARAREKAVEFESSPGGWQVSVGITIIGFPRIVRYLSEDDLNSADFIMPQIYNRADNLSSTAIQSRINFWRSTFNQNKVIPLAGAHHCNTSQTEMGCSSERAKNSSEFENTIAPFQAASLNAIGWWRYGSIEQGNHWQKIADFQFDRSD